MMMEVLINAGAGEIRVALVADGRLQDLSFTRTIGGGDGTASGGPSLVGAILLGRVQRVMPGMQAAFVDIGLERAGFLALREAQGQAAPAIADPAISDCVREGEAILVQVIKEPIGEKGARLSAGVTLAGRLLVMTPGRPGLMLSRRIEDADQRAGLLARGQAMLALVPGRLPPEAGFILRTQALGADPDELAQDALALADSWRAIAARRAGARPPVLLHSDLDPIARTLRDMARGEVSRVLIDDARAAQAARAYCRQAMPDMESRIELAGDALFARYDLEEEIARLAHPRVALPAGGWITIETTEALTAIDVNSGGFTQGGGLEETGFAVNLEAAREMGRQIRLRGIGGLIVADFINMRDAAHGEKILAALADSLAFDRAPVQISPMAAFGIVAITRKRVREPLARLTSAACPCCRGAGRMATVQSVALALLRQVEREARAAPGREILAEAAPEVAEWLTAHGDEIREQLARRGVGRVRFAGVAGAREAFDVRAI